jgi:hypothetical protein
MGRHVKGGNYGNQQQQETKHAEDRSGRSRLPIKNAMEDGTWLDLSDWDRRALNRVPR